MLRPTIRARVALPLVLSLAAVVLVVPRAGASTFTPTRFDDPPPDGCAPADCSLREAIIAANAAADPDTIKLKAGTYRLTVGGVAEDAAATGDLDIREDVTVTGEGAGTTIIDGAWPTGPDRIFHVVLDPDTELVMSGVTIRDGGGQEAAAGILAEAGTTLTLSNSIVTSGQTAGEVGGIWAINATTTLENVVISNNRSECCGGISNSSGTMTIRNSSIVGNRSADDSGGIYNAGVLTITDSTISENMTTGPGPSTQGGGLFNDFGQAALTNVTISANSSTSAGGGFQSDNSATTTLNNVTITGNVADTDNDGSGDGGGISILTGSIISSNTIVAGNTDRGGQAPDCLGTYTSQGYNLIQNTSGCTGFTGPGDITGRNPKLGPLDDNGGPTETHALLADSPAIDNGNPATPGSGGSACAATDQRGAPRNCDIGAYEVALCGGVIVNRVGTGGDDTLPGTPGADGFLAGNGNDTATGLRGDDAFCLGAGNDRFLGGDGNDKGTGGAGRDLLKGQGGRDLLKGKAGKDRLIGGSDKDKLLGGGGKDKLNCGPGTKELGKGGPGNDKAVNCEKGKP